MFALMHLKQNCTTVLKQRRINMKNTSNEIPDKCTEKFCDCMNKLDEGLERTGPLFNGLMYILIVILPICFFYIICTEGLGLDSGKKNTPETYKTYTVKAGDCLNYIARITECDVQDILKLNDLESPSSLIYEGQKLKLPSYAKWEEKKETQPAVTCELSIRAPLRQIISGAFFIFSYLNLLFVFQYQF